jgi:hypothetical protein
MYALALKATNASDASRELHARPLLHDMPGLVRGSLGTRRRWRFATLRLDRVRDGPVARCSLQPEDLARRAGR